MKRSLLASTIALLTCSQHAPGQQLKSPEDLNKYVNHLMDVHMGVENMIPPGSSIVAKPVTLEREPDGTVGAQFHIFVSGAPAETIFEQQTLPVGEDTPVTSLQGISIGKDGILMCPGKTIVQCGDSSRPNDPIEFTVAALKGEPFRFEFASIAATVGLIIVPNPVAKVDHGCGLSAVRLTPGFELALLTASGFPPNTDIHYAISSGEGAERTARTDARGVMRFSVLAHAKPGQKGGSATVKINEKQCSPEVKYEWGRP